MFGGGEFFPPNIFQESKLYGLKKLGDGGYAIGLDKENSA